MDYTEAIMALYSWFLRTDKKPSITNVNINKDLSQKSQSAKYIENYTMWPTAKIKPNVEVTVPNYSDKLVTPTTAVLSTKTPLTIIKS